MPKLIEISDFYLIIIISGKKFKAIKYILLKKKKNVKWMISLPFYPLYFLIKSPDIQIKIIHETCQ